MITAGGRKFLPVSFFATTLNGKILASVELAGPVGVKVDSLWGLISAVGQLSGKETIRLRHTSSPGVAMVPREQERQGQRYIELQLHNLVAFARICEKVIFSVICKAASTKEGANPGLSSLSLRAQLDWSASLLLSTHAALVDQLTTEQNDLRENFRGYTAADVAAGTMSPRLDSWSILLSPHVPPLSITDTNLAWPANYFSLQVVPVEENKGESVTVSRVEPFTVHKSKHPVHSTCASALSSASTKPNDRILTLCRNTIKERWTSTLAHVEETMLGPICDAFEKQEAQVCALFFDATARGHVLGTVYSRTIHEECSFPPALRIALAGLSTQRGRLEGQSLASLCSPLFDRLLLMAKEVGTSQPHPSSELCVRVPGLLDDTCLLHAAPFHDQHRHWYLVLVIQPEVYQDSMVMPSAAVKKIAELREVLFPGEGSASEAGKSGRGSEAQTVAIEAATAATTSLSQSQSYAAQTAAEVEGLTGATEVAGEATRAVVTTTEAAAATSHAEASHQQKRPPAKTSSEISGGRRPGKGGASFRRHQLRGRG